MVMGIQAFKHHIYSYNIMQAYVLFVKIIYPALYTDPIEKILSTASFSSITRSTRKQRLGNRVIYHNTLP
jgi:hypothetical protein